MAPRRGTMGGGGGDVEAVAKCCVPTECVRQTRLVTDPREAVRVLCNNEQCPVGQLMHRECFEQWESTVLAYLRTCGRARSWSERQRLQNLWTKKGYDLAYKACSCTCGRGHIRKDPDWVFPTLDDLHDAKKKKRKPKGPSRLPSLQQDPRLRTSSQSSCSSQSPPGSAPNLSPLHSSILKKKNKIDYYPENCTTVRTISNGSGIFCRRMDFSTFNCLPRHKLNSYHIKMEDEGHHGNDETRSFVLSTLASQQASKVVCILCRAPMQVYDRYPLVDGSFFLSPRQHTSTCIEVKVEGKSQFLSAVCMGCLEAWAPGRRLRCRYCSTPWDGSSLVLGTMYNYDIFAAMPCCTERIKCNSCAKPLLLPHQRLNFFSDYSHSLACPHCCAQDHHFVKPLGHCYTTEQP